MQERWVGLSTKEEGREKLSGENAGEVGWPLDHREGSGELPGKDAREVGWPLDQGEGGEKGKAAAQ